MTEVLEVSRCGILAVDVKPDEASGFDSATEDLSQIEGGDIGEALANGNDGIVEVCLDEGGARVIGVSGGIGQCHNGFAMSMG